MKNKKITERCVNANAKVINALKQMDVRGVKSLLVISDSNSFKGILSIGDIQRSIIRNESLEQDIQNILRTNPRFVEPNTNIEFIKNEMIRYRMEFMPVVDENKQIVDVYFWEELFGVSATLPVRQINLPVVIMAGGLGTRLRPLTSVFPKPLIPYGERTIVEEIMQRFANHGCNEFYLSINYKAELIEYYLNDLHLPYKLNYFREKTPLGTAGSLYLLKGKIQNTFIVTNCDILVNQPIDEIVDFHKENRNEITIVAAMQHHAIPYGMLETSENGKLQSITEKPELTFKINTGLYILEPHLIKEIPCDSIFHITQLVEKLQIDKRKVGVFPVSEKSWIDIGEWNEYWRLISK